MYYNLEPKYHNAIILTRASKADVSFHDVPHYVADEMEKILKGYNDATIRQDVLATDRGDVFSIFTVTFTSGGEIKLFLQDMQLPEGYKLVKDEDEDEKVEETSDEINS